MTGRRPTLCVVAGPNGSGKTTTTIQLLSRFYAQGGPSETCSISGYTDSGVTTTVRKNAVGDRVG